MSGENIDQTSLAKAAGVSQPSVNDWMSGKTRSMKGASGLRAAAYLRVSARWLIEGKGQMLDGIAAPAGGGAIGGDPIGGLLAGGDAPHPTVTQMIEQLGELMSKAPPSTREAVTSLLLKYSNDPAQGGAIARAIEMLIKDASAS